MEKENIFIIGGQVKGASFIGRRKLLEKYRKDFLESSITDPRIISVADFLEKK